VLAVNSESLFFQDNYVKIMEYKMFMAYKSDCIKKTLTKFAQSILSPDEYPLTDAEEADINNMAVIESAYLSAKTAVPEEPQRILNMVKTK
jgi:hypothetical protein